ncbi:MAG TPA: hypothetical protein VKB80_07340 [Kofleriaceae bacterium]|nr:hypothetical protein [Kofleriaceae bacterium]
MKPIANRTSASGDITPEQELALAQEMLRIQSEEELDHFLPLLLPAIKLAAPLLMKAAGPLLKTVAGSLLGGGGGRRRRPPRGEEEQFLGKIARGLFGEVEAESEEEEQFLGGILKGILGGEMEAELEAEEEQFLGGIIGKLFGGELEAENHVQEQFIGGLFGKLFGGELEAEYQAEADGEDEVGERVRLGRARRVVRLAARASRRAARQLVALIQAGQRPTLREARRIIFSSIVATARQMRSGHHGHHGRRPRLIPASAGPGAGGAGPGGFATGPGPTAQVGPPMSAAGAPPQGETILDRMISGARPFAGY